MNRTDLLRANVAELPSFSLVKLANRIRRSSSMDKFASADTMSAEAECVVHEFEKVAFGAVMNALGRGWTAAKNFAGRLTAPSTAPARHIGQFAGGKAGLSAGQTTAANRRVNQAIKTRSQMGNNTPMTAEELAAGKAQAIADTTAHRQQRLKSLERAKANRAARGGARREGGPAVQAQPNAQAGLAATPQPGFVSQHVTPHLQSAGNWIQANPGTSAALAGGGMLGAGLLGRWTAPNQPVVIKTGEEIFHAGMDLVDAVDPEASSANYDRYDSSLCKLAEAYDTRDINLAYVSLRELVATADTRD